MKPRWLNPSGYDDPLIPRTTAWERFLAREVRRFQLDMTAPLTLCVFGDVFCDLWQPPMDFCSDGASIPRLLTILPGYSRTAYEPAPYLHDGEHAQRCVFHARVLSSMVFKALATLGDHADAHIVRTAEFCREESHTPAANERYRLALLASDCPDYRARVQTAVLNAVGVRW
jgi:hypothetical protein